MAKTKQAENVPAVGEMKILNQSYELVDVSLLRLHPQNPRRGGGTFADTERERS